MEFLRSDKNAQWLVPVVLGVASCLCSFGVMLFLFAQVVVPMDTSMPLEDLIPYAMRLSETLSAGQLLYITSMYCIPPVLLVGVGIVSFFFVRGYQAEHQPPKPPPPAPPPDA